MRKLFFVLSIVCLLAACKNAFDDVDYEIKNNSSIPVSFLFNGASKSLNSGESIAFTVNSNAGMFSPRNVVPYNAHPRSVKTDTLNLGTKGYIYTFKDSPRFGLEIINKLPVQVTIQSDDYIDNDGKFSLTILENSNVISYIYTSKPNFTLLSEPFQVVFDWTFKDDTVYLVIR